ncbi:MAG: hypothetical protein HND47_03885 [Chloroflexi bacterium]|nr:hypothetical protein [Chloroflexota bacterium]
MVAENTNTARPAPLTTDEFPTLVLGAEADPATPIANGQSVFSRLPNAYLVTQTGGRTSSLGAAFRALTTS